MKATPLTVAIRKYFSIETIPWFEFELFWYTLAVFLVIATLESLSSDVFRKRICGEKEVADGLNTFFTLIFVA